MHVRKPIHLHVSAAHSPSSCINHCASSSSRPRCQVPASAPHPQRHTAVVMTRNTKHPTGCLDTRGAINKAPLEEPFCITPQMVLLFLLRLFLLFVLFFFLFVARALR